MSEDRLPAGAKRQPRSNLQLRVISGVVLALLVFALTYLGGVAFRLLAAIIGLAVFFEWQVMAASHRKIAFRVAGWVLMVACAAVVVAGAPALTMFATIGAAVMLAWVAGLFLGQGTATAGGLAYAGFPMAALALLRGDALEGVVAVIFLFAVVWATDIFAYFAGRRFGGPKLAPAISPNKTWSGAVGGGIAAMLAGLCVALVSNVSVSIAVVLGVALFLTVVAQLGDLAESGVKRHFGVKDSGAMIPGHGGMMDRVDGLMAAALVMWALGAISAGADTPAARLFAAVGS